MRVELDKEDLICLVRGGSPSHRALTIPFIKEYCDYSDQYGRYTWHGLEKLSEDSLWNIYYLVKNTK